MIALVRFTTAKTTYNEEGVLEFHPKDYIWINPSMVVSVEDHVINEQGIRHVVMDKGVDIVRKLILGEAIG